MEMKNICGKIPVELHEKLKLEVEELGISICSGITLEMSGEKQDGRWN